MQLELSSDLVPFGSATVRQCRVSTLTGGDGYRVIHRSQEYLSIRKTHRNLNIKGLFADLTEIFPAIRFGDFDPVVRCVCHGRFHPRGRNGDLWLRGWQVTNQKLCHAVVGIYLGERNIEINGVLPN